MSFGVKSIKARPWLFIPQGELAALGFGCLAPVTCVQRKTEQKMHLHKAELAQQANSPRTVLLEIIRPALYRRQQMGKNMSCQPGLGFNSPVLVQGCYFSVSDGVGRGISQEVVIGWEWSERKGRTWFRLA